MSTYPCPKIIKHIITILFILGTTNVLFSREASSDKSELQKEARIYRSQGLELQQNGDLEGAMSLYQKAIALDPAYAVVYNDAGVIYEAYGNIDSAEESYLKTLKIDPAYLSAYANLALLYENKRQLDKAAYYWNKRVELGLADDPWTEKARKRLADIRAVLSDNPLQTAQQEQVSVFLKDVANQKALLKKDNRELAKSYFEQAKLSYKKGDDVTALKKAIDAQQLDPANSEIKEFIDKIQLRLLSR